MTSKTLFSKDSFGCSQEAGSATMPNISRIKKLRTMTSFGTDIACDDMLMDRKQEKEEIKQMEAMLAPTPKKLNVEFQRDKKEFVDLLILRTRFKDTKERKVLLKRRDDWIKDLNMNLVKGKVVRSTHYFDDLDRTSKLTLLKALDSEPGVRED